MYLCEKTEKTNEAHRKIQREREMEGEVGGEIYRLPEGCISHVFSLTSPRDCCRSAAVSTTFRSAADSDTVWERFLPPDYQEVLSRAVDPVADFSSKRDLYFRLCDPILIDGGKRSFALERSSGRKCYTLSARELVIIWGDTPDYWRWIPHSDSRFSEVAELLDVCWLEISGKIDCKILSPKTAYAAYLIFKIALGSHCFGFPNQEALVKVGIHVSEHLVCIEPDEARTELRHSFPFSFMNSRRHRSVTLQQRQEGTHPVVRGPRERGDGWMEIELGDFFNDDGNDGDVDISFKEVKEGHWKSGLIIQGIEVRPKK